MMLLGNFLPSYNNAYNFFFSFLCPLVTNAQEVRRSANLSKQYSLIALFYFATVFAVPSSGYRGGGGGIVTLVWETSCILIR